MQDLNETPGSRDIVLYDALPNSLPRVGGIITSVIQTPLSHVNLRAIQDNVPNAYIADPLSINEIASLLNGYIYYKVENDSYEIRQATLDEVNAWYEDIRPTQPQVPIRDLSFTDILPLDEITFEMSTGFGAKCANVATMRTFEFIEGTIPNGFGIPFYYYDEFMQYNNFYEEVQIMIENPSFQNEKLNNTLQQRNDELSDSRLSAIIKDQETLIKALENKNTELTDSLSDLKNKNFSLKDQVENLNQSLLIKDSRILDLKDRLEDLSEKVQIIEIEKVNLENDLERRKVKGY